MGLEVGAVGDEDTVAQGRPRGTPAGEGHPGSGRPAAGRTPDLPGTAAERLQFEPMTLSDLPDVLAIERASFPAPWSERAFMAELLHNAYADYVVARLDGRLVGYGGMWIMLDEAHVTNIAVHPEFRRQGIGERILCELIRRAARRRCERMTLEVRKSNFPAQRLYLKHGFVPRGVRKGYYTDNNEDAIIMWKYDLRRYRDDREEAVR